MWIGVISLFPEMFAAVSEFGITGRAVDQGLVKLACWNPREFTQDRHKTVDDKPYGGGPGMLMKVAPLRQAVKAAREAAATETGNTHARVVYLSPQGRRLTQQDLGQLAKEEAVILLAGRYEGIDERLVKQEVDDELSIGDYVLSGGELPAMVVIDGISRLLPGAVGDENSVSEDSFSLMTEAGQPLLDYPQYTRPEVIDGDEVPSVLLSGHHTAIAEWRLQQAIGRTVLRRPDLLDRDRLSKKELELLEAFLAESEGNRGKHDE